MPHGTDSLLLELFTIFVWAKVFGELFERLGMPAVLGEILAGVALGPYATGFIVPSATVTAIAEIGAIFLLFTVGLETSPADLIRVGSKSVRVALFGVLLPFILGFGYLMLQHAKTHEAAFVGAAMVATSVGITARILRDLHVLKSHAAQIILGAAVFDDILGMILLAVVASLAVGGGIHWVHLAIISAEAIGFALFMIFIGPRLINRVRPGLKRLSMHNAPLILALALCLGLSVASTTIGMAAIIGAFFAGLIFADYSPEWNLQPRIQAINEFLAPFFFFTMGARLDLHVFNREVVIAASVITVLAFISKILGCGLPLIREGRMLALKVGMGMTPRGEVALIVALIGLQMNAISQTTYAIVIFMTAFTTLIPPFFIKRMFRAETETAQAELELEGHPAEEESEREENLSGRIG
ncbi:MAG: cation:proton antiporter [Terriglobia bacterium]|jgi:Kef-type K+ transport system membrane component KefB|nr:cation:proton antiporter [Terriglobia bacterium]